MADQTPRLRRDIKPVPPVIHVVPQRVQPTDKISSEQAELLEALDVLADAENTIAAYRTDLKQFGEWCQSQGFRSFSRTEAAAEEVVALWAASLAQAGWKLATIKRKLAAISSAHTRLELKSPCRSQRVKRIVKSLTKKLGSQQKKMLPLEPSHYLEIMKRTKRTVRWKRDRVILLLGLSGAMRESELVLVRVEHLLFGLDTSGNEGLTVFIPSSKTDQEGKGMTKYMPKVGGPTCVVQAIKAWLKRSGIESGYLFRKIRRGGQIDMVGEKPMRPRNVAKIVRRYVAKISKEPKAFAGHSLRAGFITSGKSMGISDFQLMRQTGHKNQKTMDGYNRPQDVFGPNNPLHKILRGQNGNG